MDDSQGHTSREATDNDIPMMDVTNDTEPTHFNEQQNDEMPENSIADFTDGEEDEVEGGRFV